MWLALRAEPHGPRTPPGTGRGRGCTSKPRVQEAQQPRARGIPVAALTGVVRVASILGCGSLAVWQWPFGMGRWGGRQGEKRPIQDLC